MAKKAGGLAAWFDRSTVAQCPTCGASEPDPARRGFCLSCGTLFRDKFWARWQLAETAAILGVVVVAAGALLALAADQKWFGLAVFLLGLAPLVYGLKEVREHAQSLLAALALRSSSDTLKLFSRANIFCGVLTLVFVVMLAACIPYYVTIVHPQQKVGTYQSVFESKVQEYAMLVPADAVVPEGTAARLIGKVLVLDRPSLGEPKVSAVQASLPPELRAGSPAEVGTVVWIAWSDKQYSKYSNSQLLAFRRVAHITLIDKAQKTVLGEAEIEGGLPPQHPPSTTEHGYGPYPLDEIVKYLSELPRAETAPATPSAPAPPAANAEEGKAP